MQVEAVTVLQCPLTAIQPQSRPTPSLPLLAKCLLGRPQWETVGWETSGGEQFSVYIKTSLVPRPLSSWVGVWE